MTVCGLDEAGRGPLAGPVTAAAVILPEEFPRHLLRDSKKLSPAVREELARLIRREAASYALGWVWPGEIDRINIHRASLLAMKRAFEDLPGQPPLPDKALADGKFPPDLPVPTEAVIKGDDFVPEIQAASILAKTARDRWMIRYSWIEPLWRFDKHKGYPTREHRELCERHGLSPIHRRSFKYRCSAQYSLPLH